VTQNLYFNGGLFADNGDKSVMISRGDDIVFDNTTFVGQTEFANKDCRIEKVAIHLDPVRLQETVLWNFNGNKKGTIIKNAKFRDWSQEKTGCPSKIATPLKFYSHQTFIKSYSAPHLLENLEFDSEYYVDAKMSDSGIDDVSIQVIGDKNKVLTAGDSGFLISPKLESMITTKCRDYNEDLKFCPNTCLRTITIVAGNSAFAEEIDMVVNDANGNGITIKKDVRGHPGPAPKSNRFFSAYTIVLPSGTFDISFRESASDALSWPKFAFVVPEAAPALCSDYVKESDLMFVKPKPNRPICDELIYNGSFDSGEWETDGWYAFHHPIEWQKIGGINGSPALATSTALNRGNNIAQSLDCTCLEAGNEYDVSFSYNITEYDGSSNNLPYIGLQSQKYLTDDPKNKRFETISTPKLPMSAQNVNDDWTKVSGVWKIDEEIAKADKHIFFVGGGAHKVVIDNVTIRKRITPVSNLRRSHR